MKMNDCAVPARRRPAGLIVDQDVRLKRSSYPDSDYSAESGSWDAVLVMVGEWGLFY